MRGGKESVLENISYGVRGVVSEGRDYVGRAIYGRESYIGKVVSGGRKYLVGAGIGLAASVGCDSNFFSLVIDVHDNVKSCDVVDSTTTQPVPDEQGELCSNDCAFAFDGDCDDGGPGSDYSLCALGTDCSDCGPR